MDIICQDLGIPKKQIKETSHPDRFIVVVKKSWLKNLAQNGKVGEFATHPGLDEWPGFGCNIGYSWTKVYIHAYRKFTHKVIPLPRYRADQVNTDGTETPLSFSQLLHYVSQSNHKNLWKSAYKQFESSSSRVKSSHSNETSNKKSDAITLLPYENVLRDVITRTYGCQIIDLNGTTVSPQSPCTISTSPSEYHANLYPIVAAIETSAQILIVYDSFVEHTLSDCITYSPSILDKSNNKRLFMIYQLLSLMKALHDRGLLLGEISLTDIYLTENLWIQVIPRLDCNTIKLNEFVEERSMMMMTRNDPGLTNPLDFYSKYKFSTSSPEIPPSFSLRDYCEMWCHGQITNFDYLTILNNLSGRRLGCPGYHHIMPWVTDFTSKSGMNWRDLTKSKYRLNKGDPQLDLMFSSTNCDHQIPHHVSDVLSEITYYVYMARRTPKTVLCRHVRPIWVPAEYPASIQRLQEWTPDECIPEFYNDPLVFKSMHDDLPDLEVPIWSSCPENFITKHREALESQYVSERLHHWIDLTFGYKLSGAAAVKAKNVCLPLVDNHTNLAQRGVVQLFQHPHPPKQFPSIWTGKVPPRIYPQNEMRRRLTRSSEDLSTTEAHATGVDLVKGLTKLAGSVDETNTNIERSISYHMNVMQKSANVIILPKDYNPTAQLQAVENMEIFLAKIFYNNYEQQNRPTDRPSADGSSQFFNIDDYPEANNAFTNRIFMENFEATNKGGTAKNFKQIIAERRYRELQIIGCLIVELFLPHKIRPMMLDCDGSRNTFEMRFQSCARLLQFEFDQLPKCVQYPVHLLLGGGGTGVITERGLPNPSAHQLLQPLMSNSLFPFPLNFIQVYTLIRTLYQFGGAYQLLNLLAFFECDGKSCGKYEVIDKTRIALNRKIAECKVKACVVQIEGLLDPVGFEQFNAIDLLLPHIIDLISNDDTSIMAAWYLFDPVATALGPNETRHHLLEPILKLYDGESNERINFLNSNFDSSMKFTTSAAYKSKKSYKLYHHSFLLKLIVRFGLRVFLENFISPLIEGVGGYKDPEPSCAFHSHNEPNNVIEMKKSRSTKNFTTGERSTSISDEITVDEVTITSPVSDKSDKTLSPTGSDPNDIVTDEIFDFEHGDHGNSTTKSNEDILKLITNTFEIKSVASSLDLRLNHSTAEEVTEETPINDDNFQINDFIYGEEQFKFYTELGHLNSSFDEDVVSYKSVDSPQKSPGLLDRMGPTSPTIPIPTTFNLGRELSVIGCEIGSKKSIDSSDFLMQATPTDSRPTANSSTAANNVITTPNQPPPSGGDPFLSSLNSSTISKTNESTSTSITITSNKAATANKPSRISEMSAESLIWLSHRLGPVLSARYLTRNLLKMLTLCYVGQENLFPSDEMELGTTAMMGTQNLQMFSVSKGRVVGDQNAIKVLECLTGISALFGEQFILLQYFPHVSELIALCKKRITPSLEGGLISSLQLLKYLVPYLCDSTIMDQLHDIILPSIIHPIIRLLGSSRCIMPNGFLARSVLARKLLDTLYILAIRIGPEMTREFLCVPALQRFFCIFNKAYGINDQNQFLDVGNNSRPNDPSPTNSDDNNFVEIRRDGGTREWCIKGSPIKISHARVKGDDSFESITPPPNIQPATSIGNTSVDSTSLKEKAMEEIQDVFTPNLAHTAYLIFLNYLGENIMRSSIKNLALILNLCHEFEQPTDGDETDAVNIKKKLESTNLSELTDEAELNSLSNNFSSNVAIVGNRLEVQSGEQPDGGQGSSEMNPGEILDMVTYKLENMNATRHLRGNWLAYWEHEIGRSDKDNHFNLKQIKLQSFHGHTNSVRTILPLNNENSFMSASKDKTVKLWSLRSEGDGTKISSCQFTYTAHKKSVHSLTFLESYRLAISCDSGVHLWDPFVGEQKGQLDSSRYSPVSVVKTLPAPSSLVLCGTADASIKTIDTRTFTYVNEWKTTMTPGGAVRCVAVSPSGSWIGVGLSSGQLVLLDGRTGLIISSWRANDGELLQLVAPNESQLISSSLDHSISVWSTLDGSLMYQLKSPPEPAHLLLINGNELLSGTPANRIGIHSSISQDAVYTITKLRSENFRGALTSLAILPLNRMLLVGGDSGNISLLC